jgi:predicted metal-dependent phosphoesterase TrpH
MKQPYEKLVKTYSNLRHRAFTSKREDFLKCCFHAHTKEGNPYSAEDLLDVAKKQGYDVVAITEHDEVHFTGSMRERAEYNGLVLLPGIEASVGDEGDHVLVVNTKNFPRGRMKSLEDLRIWLSHQDREKILVVAPHPFYPGKICVGDKLEENIDMFDAIEFSYFRSYIWRDNPNRRAIEIAKKYNKPMIGTGDVHRLWQLGTTYSLLRSERDADSIVAAVKESGFNGACVENHFENVCSLDSTIIVETRYLGLREIWDVLKMSFPTGKKDIYLAK